MIRMEGGRETAQLRKKHDGAFKARVVLEVFRSQKSITDIASEYGIRPNQITKWKKHFMDQLPEIFSRNYHSKERLYKPEKEALLKKIGQLEMDRVRL
jgi:transposase-like protein